MRILDISVKETSVCIVDEAGKICREIKIIARPEDLLQLMHDTAWNLEGAVASCVEVRMAGSPV
ncbi:hypothetical protein P0R31_38375 [Bradyrhizobium yuanmingense]|nr:hypothetical protein [Bradyrhizobium yuanmingense]MDF0523090.1 hypothetical protein [Bradyrhizobium yuanmingense]